MTDRFHNLSTEQLADEIGKLDTLIKAHAEDLDALKDEFKRRGSTAVRGDLFVVTSSTSTSKRLDTKRLRADLGDALDEYEVESTTTRLLIKPSPKLADVA